MSLQKILLQHEPKPENLLKVLKQIQKENKYIGEKESKKVARYFSLPLAQLYSAASFFDDLKLKNDAKITIKICSGGPCLSEDSAKVARQIEMLLKIEAENDAHPKYKLEYMSCRGLCDRGPVIEVNGQVFEKVRPELVDDILQSYL